MHIVCPVSKYTHILVGTTMIGYQPLWEHPNFFRYVCSNPAATEDDIDFLLNEIRRLGLQLEEKDLITQTEEA